MGEQLRVISLLDVDEKDCILELLIQNAVDNNDQKSLATLKKLPFINPDGSNIDIDWDSEIDNIRAKVKNIK